MYVLLNVKISQTDGDCTDSCKIPERTSRPHRHTINCRWSHTNLIFSPRKARASCNGGSSFECVCVCQCVCVLKTL